MAEKILIIEDEAKIARFIELELAHEGYETDKAEVAFIIDLKVIGFNEDRNDILLAFAHE